MLTDTEMLIFIIVIAAATFLTRIIPFIKKYLQTSFFKKHTNSIYFIIFSSVTQCFSILSIS